MVDLVKIRKKAREKKEEEAAASARSKSAPAEPESSAEAPPERAAKGKGKGKPAARERSGKEKEEKPAAPRLPQDGATPPPAAGGAADGPAKESGGAPSPEGERRHAETAPEAAKSRLDEFKGSAGTRRSDLSARAGAAAVEPSAPQMELLTFTLAGEQYAIEIERIAEIIAPRPTTPVPNAPRPVVGIISLRGTIVTMLDLRRQLGHESEYTVGPETRTIVVEDGGGMAGFVVDRVLRVVKVDPSQIQNHPIVSPSEQTEAIRGVIQQGTALTIILDVERLLS